MNIKKAPIKNLIWPVLILAGLLSVSINLFHYLNFPQQASQITPQSVLGYTSMDEGRYTSSGDSAENTEIIFDYGKILPGVYHGTIEYDSEQTRKLSFSAIPSAYLKASDLFLDHRLHRISFSVTVLEPLKNLKISADCAGEKDFSINLQLNKDRIIYIRNLVASVIIFSFIAAELFLFSKHPKTAKRSMLILTISVIAFVPYLLEGLNSGHDFPFHFMRIEGIADGLRDGQFPVYLQSNWLGNHGYPAALFYGDILLYIPALFRLAGFTFDASFKIFVFLINVLTCLTSFISFRKIFKNEKASWVLVFAYVCSPYRLIDVFVRCAVGEYCAMAFLPLVCSGFYGIIKTETNLTNWKEEVKPYIRYLSIGMTGILLTHILTTVMSAALLLFSCLLLCRRVFSLRRIKAFCTAAVKSLMLSAIFLVPFIDFYFSNDLDINHNIDTQIPTIQSSGVQPGEFLTFFKDIFGPAHENTGLGDRLYLSIGMTLTLTIAAAVLCIVKEKSTKYLRFMTFLSLLCLFLSSNLFPYNAIAYNNRIGIFLSQIQFPWRFLSMTTLFTVFVMGELLSILQKSLISSQTGIHPDIRNLIFPVILSVLSFFILIEATLISSNYASDATRNLYLNTNDIEVGTVLLDHGLRYDSNPEYFLKHIEADDVSVEILNDQGTHWKLHCITGNEPGSLILPLTNYKGYRIIDEYGQEYNIYENWNKEISFMVKNDFDGIIDVFFQPQWYWKTSALISILCMVWTALSCLISIRKTANPPKTISQ